MDQFKYDIWTRPSVKLSEDTDAPQEWSELEGMIFASPVQVGDEVRVLVDESCGVPNNNLLSDAPLNLGEVQRICQYPAFNGTEASTRLILERTRADDRFEKFVSIYNALK